MYRGLWYLPWKVGRASFARTLVFVQCAFPRRPPARRISTVSIATEYAKTSACFGVPHTGPHTFLDLPDALNHNRLTHDPHFPHGHQDSNVASNITRDARILSLGNGPAAEARRLLSILPTTGNPHTVIANLDRVHVAHALRWLSPPPNHHR
jgi:hypothetical protein